MKLLSALKSANSMAEELFAMGLEKNPGNDEAIIGLFMARYGFSGVNSFTPKKIIATRPLNGLVEFKKNIGKENLPFFDSIEATAAHATLINNNLKKEAKIKEDNAGLENRLENVQSEYSKTHIRFWGEYQNDIEVGPMVALVISIVVMVIIVVLSFVFVFGRSGSGSNLSVGLGMLLLAALDLALLLNSYWKLKRAKELEIEYSELSRSIRKNTGELGHISEENRNAEKSISQSLNVARTHLIEHMGNRFI